MYDPGVSSNQLDQLELDQLVDIPGAPSGQSSVMETRTNLETIDILLDSILKRKKSTPRRDWEIVVRHP